MPTHQPSCPAINDPTQPCLCDARAEAGDSFLIRDDYYHGSSIWPDSDFDDVRWRGYTDITWP